MIGEAGKSPTIGDPLVKGASVTLEVLDQVRGDKIDVIKFKRRQNYHRQLGHKQHLTKVKIAAISKSASKAKAKAKAKAADKASSESASDAQADKE